MECTGTGVVGVNPSKWVKRGKLRNPIIDGQHCVMSEKNWLKREKLYREETHQVEK